MTFEKTAIPLFVYFPLTISRRKQQENNNQQINYFFYLTVALFHTSNSNKFGLHWTVFWWTPLSYHEWYDKCAL